MPAEIGPEFGTQCGKVRGIPLVRRDKDLRQCLSECCLRMLLAFEHIPDDGWHLSMHGGRPLAGLALTRQKMAVHELEAIGDVGGV